MKRGDETPLVTIPSVENRRKPRIIPNYANSKRLDGQFWDTVKRGYPLFARDVDVLNYKQNVAVDRLEMDILWCEALADLFKKMREETGPDFGEELPEKRDLWKAVMQVIWLPKLSNLQTDIENRKRLQWASPPIGRRSRRSILTWTPRYDLYNAVIKEQILISV